MALGLVDDQFEGGVRRSIQRQQMLRDICPDGVFLRIRGKRLQGFRRTGRWAEYVGVGGDVTG